MLEYLSGLKLIPFILTVGIEKKLNLQRILEGIVIGLVAATGTFYTMREDIHKIQSDISEIKIDVKTAKSDASKALTVQAGIIPLREEQIKQLQKDDIEQRVRIKCLETGRRGC